MAEGRRVALTFDIEHPDRPSPTGVEESILATLGGAGVRATFFLQGRWVSAYPELACRIVEAGHLAANHSHFHAPMNRLTDAGFRHDVKEAEATIRAVTGADPRPWFRCPFGAGMEDRHVLDLLAELGYRHVGWDVDPTDWDEDVGAAEVERVVLDAVRDDSTVLLHGWPGATAAALPAIVDRLAGAGVELVTV